MSLSTDVKSPSLGDSRGSTKDSKGDKKGAPMATIHDDDERLLAEIGYEQVEFLI
jgi:hypothetical protein